MKQWNRIMALLLAFVMTLTLVPTLVFANDAAQTATVYFTLIKDGKFEGPARKELVVSSTTAEEYGYEDAGVGVTLLDAVVAKHVEVFGEAFTKDTAQDYLSFSGTWMTNAFANGSAAGYSVNGVAPWDLTPTLNDGDNVVFQFYQDTVGWSDTAVQFDRDMVTVEAGKEVTLTVSYSYWDYTANAMVDVTVDGTKDSLTVCLINADGSFGDELDAAFDENGKVTVSFDTAGTYELTVKGTLAGDKPVFLPYCKVVVTASQEETTPEPETKPDTKPSVTVTPDADYSKSFAASLDRLASDLTPEYGMEWGVLTLARAGKLTAKQAESYCAALEKHVKEVGSAKIGRYATDNCRVLLTLAAIGKTEKVGEYDLAAALSEEEYIKKSGLNGAIFTLLAWDAVSFDDKASAVKRDDVIDWIVTSQLTNGGFSFWLGKDDTQEASVDMTAMALQALAPYKDKDSVKACIDKAIDFLSKAQNEKGGYEYMGVMNSEAAAQVIVALTSLGINPETDARFVKNGCSVVDSMLAFAVADGGFGHETQEYNAYASLQCSYALVAYDRFLAGKTSLYDMSDVKNADDSQNSENSTKKPEVSPNTGDNGASMMYVVMLFAAVLAITGVYSTSKRNRI